MKKNIMIMIAAAVLAACGSHKTVQQTEQMKPTVTVTDEPKAPEVTNVSAKADILVNAMGQTINVDGKIQLRYGEVMRVLITPYGLMEVARLEFTPDYVMLVNRMGNEYVKVSYDDLNAMGGTSISFNQLQEVVWKQSFIPGNKIDLALDIPGVNGKTGLTLTLGKVSNEPNWDARTVLNNNYKQVSVQEMFNKIVNR